MTRIAIACLLLSTAVAKSWQVLFEPASLALQGGVLSSKWAVIAIVEAEMFLAVCLLLNLWRRAIWAATVVMFCGFAAYSIAMVAMGVRSCGCFGSLSELVVPHWALLMDVAVIVALCIFRPHTKLVRPASVRIGDPAPKSAGADRTARDSLWPIWVILFLALMPLIGGAAALYEPTPLIRQPGLTLFEDGACVAEPAKWIGGTLPLIDYLDTPSHRVQLSAGTWRILIAREGCVRCEKPLQSFLSHVLTESYKDRRRAVILIPDAKHQNPTHLLPGMTTEVLVTRLNARLTWFLYAPLLVDLDAGQVQRVVEK